MNLEVGLTTIITSQSQPFVAEHKEKVGLAMPALFLAWAPPSHTRRSVLMARKLGIPLRRIYVLKMKPYLAPVRYTVQAFLTLITLFREQPKIIFVQNPPVFAPLLVWIYCALTKASMIIDSHTGAFNGVWRWILPRHSFLSRRAITTIVTNEYLSCLVTSWGAKSQIIVDVPSEFPEGKPYVLEHPFNVAMVSSFAPDEPLDEVIQVAQSLPDVGLYITGDPARSHKRLASDLPPNVHLTGFLPEGEFYGLLRSAQCIMALTKQDHTMQRGACEAVWLSQPIITSDWPLLRQTFHKGTVHVDNTVEGIRTGILQMRAKREQLAHEVLLLQEERRQQWEGITRRLETLIRQTSAN